MIYTKTFDCGLQFAFKKTRSQVSYCALSIKSGTRNEPEELSGIAHMTEHMLFKGTQKRNPQQINNRLELLGGELNAYTTKEETVIYSTVLKEDTSKAVDLLFELAFTSTFPQKELDKERSVVLDEINMYKDSPSECIFEDFEGILFEGHPLSRSILGSAKTLKKISSQDLLDYVKANFTPDNMCISIVGGISQQKAEKIVQDTVCKYISDSTPRCAVPRTGACASLKPDGAFTKEVAKKNHQVNCIVGATAYSFFNEERMALILLSNILGGPSSNSRLNQLLRERNALVYTIDCTFTQFADTGSLLIYFGCEKPNLQRCLELVNSEIASLREKPVSEKALRAAKKQLLGQMAVSSDNGEVQALSMGKSMLVFGKIMSDEEIRSRINALTAEDLQRAAVAVLAPERLSTLIFK